MLPLLRAVIVWSVLLGTVIFPRLDPPAVAPSGVAVTQLSAYDRQSVVRQTRDLRAQAADEAQVREWARELQQGIAAYQAQLKVLAAAKAVAARYGGAVGDQCRLLRIALPPELGQQRQRRHRTVPVHGWHVVWHAVGEQVTLRCCRQRPGCGMALHPLRPRPLELPGLIGRFA